MTEQKSKVILSVELAKKNLDALVYAFECRYKLALKQVRGGQQVVISIPELQADLVATRKAAVTLLGTIASLENSIEDLIS